MRGSPGPLTDPTHTPGSRDQLPRHGAAVTQKEHAMSTPTVEDTSGVTAPPPPAAVFLGAPGTGMKSPAAVGWVAWPHEPR
jgi:hypothetical protein